MYDLIIKNGQIVSATDTVRGDIAVKQGKIEKIAGAIEDTAVTVIDAEGNYVLPGVIEAHMHVLAPFQGCLGANDFYTQSVSAAFGGVTMFMDFTNTFKGACVMDAVRARMDEMSQSAIDFAIHGKLVEQKQCDEIPALYDFGIPTFKLFMTYKKEGVMADDETLIRAFSTAKEIGAVPMLHCEGNAIAEWNLEQCKRNGALSWRDFANAKPTLCEAEALARAIYFARFAGNALIVVHTTNGEALNLARAAHRDKVPLYIETCPHYLTLFDDIYDTKDGHLAICSPPLRTAREAQALWEGLGDGTIALTGSDDCTYSYEEKSMFLSRDEKGELIPDFTKVVNGLSGLEIRLPLLLGEGVSKGRITINQLCAITSENIAKVYGCYPQKGIIAEGSDADIVIVDMNREAVISHKTLHNNIGYCLHEGMAVRGVPTVTVAGGRVIMRDGQFFGQKGAGRFIKRKIAEDILTPH